MDQNPKKGHKMGRTETIQTGVVDFQC